MSCLFFLIDIVLLDCMYVMFSIFKLELIDFCKMLGFFKRWFFDNWNWFFFKERGMFVFDGYLILLVSCIIVLYLGMFGWNIGNLNLDKLG